MLICLLGTYQIKDMKKALKNQLYYHFFFSGGLKIDMSQTQLIAAGILMNKSNLGFNFFFLFVPIKPIFFSHPNNCHGFRYVVKETQKALFHINYHSLIHISSFYRKAQYSPRRCWRSRARYRLETRSV